MISGTSGSDSLNGTAGDDVIYGLEGNDTLSGGAGNDYLDGGSGNDRIFTGDGADKVIGGDGDDEINGYITNDNISYSTSSGPITASGGAGNDVIVGSTGNDSLDGGTGNDVVFTAGGSDVVFGGDGDDLINSFKQYDGTVLRYAVSGSLNASGGIGNDIIVGTTGNDTIDGGPGADKLYGGAGDDYYIVDDLLDLVSDDLGTNTGLIKVDFYKQPTGVDWVLGPGVKPLPYWLDSLVEPGSAYFDAQAAAKSGKIYYAFPTIPLSIWSAEQKSGFTPLNEAQKAFVQKIFSYIETFLNVKFELTSDATKIGVLTFANNAQSESAGYAIGSPSGNIWGVFFSNTSNSSENSTPKDGNFGGLTFLHEIGHALGLKHPFSKPDSLGVVASGPYLPDAENNIDATVMAYSYVARNNYPSTYDDLDIAALQYMYGPAQITGSAAHQTSDNIYVLSTLLSNFIWDGGGVDTLDARSANERVVLHLSGGQHSYFGGSEKSLITAAGQITINIGTVIENAFGTAYDDIIYGNSVANYIFSGAGNDSIAAGDGDDQLQGGFGDDTLDGGDGNDIAYYNRENFVSGITVDLQAGIVTGGAGNDKLISVEIIWGTEKADKFYGSSSSDWFIGDAGDDYVDGRGGVDVYQINNDFSVCTFSMDGTVCIITTKDLGRDRIENIERVVFVGTSTVWKTIAELQALASSNRAPTFSSPSQSFSTNEDTAKVVNVSATDADNDVLTYSVSTSAKHGTTSVSGGAITYTPSANYNGLDSFVVTASDGKGGTATQTINVTVLSDGITEGTDGNDTLIGTQGVDALQGLKGNDAIDGGSNVDTAVFAGTRTAYTVTQTSVGKFTVTGPDGTDTLQNIEYLKFDDQTIKLYPGTGTTVNFSTDNPATYMAAIRDFDGNDLGAADGWKRIGSADVNGDGDIDQIFVNKTNGRFAEVGTAPDGKVYFSDYGWAGETRVVGIYVDPLVQSGQVVAGSDNDSQRRFQNDLRIDNISKVLGAADYNKDGLQEVYFALTDGTAYLHAYMHADGNIQYANYQSKQQVIDFLTSNGWPASTYSGWFG